MELLIFTDGSCLGNPGKGGYAVLVVLKPEDGTGYIPYKLYAEPKEYTTNNERELSAFLQAIKYAAALYDVYQKTDEKMNRMTIISDSTYCLNAISKGWLKKWASNNFKRSGKLIPNAEIWKQVYNLVYTKKYINVIQFDWVKGHLDVNGGNDIVDEFARKAAANQEVFKYNKDRLQDLDIRF